MEYFLDEIRNKWNYIRFLDSGKRSLVLSNCWSWGAETETIIANKTRY